jgi:GTP:adenosylcobinamide-phosphate guanylyltransferase
VKAVITAGGRVNGAFAEAAGTRVKALAVVNGTTMLARVVDSLRGCGVTRLALVGGDEVGAAFAGSVERFVDESASGGQNLLKALRAWPEDGEPLLYATSDLPYITTATATDFVARVSHGALTVALTDFAVYEKRFPAAPPTGITLSGERVVNGGLFSIPPGAADRIAAVATRFFDARKRPWRMASLVNPLILVRFMLGRLRVEHLEATAAHALGVPARAARHCAPELAFDVDGIEEYRYACTHR